MPVEFPGESAEYRAARNRLLDREKELRRLMESVAEERRQLPPGGEVPEDYAFEEAATDGSLDAVRLSELFVPGGDSLVVYHAMFPRDPEDDRPGPAGGHTADLPLHDGPCPSCTALLDQLDGAVPHVEPHCGFVVVGKAPPERLRAFADERGWRHLRLVSAERTTFNHDYHGETSDGRQRPMMNVFSRAGGILRHVWGAELLYEPTEPGQDPRHVGTLEPLWNLFDLIPEGRGATWEEQLSYR
jgi:predicted dithiol-disulfide oxidoreductase (DUF899 family)